MSAETQAYERQLWSRWSVATLAGWAVGMVAGIALTYAIMALAGIEEETNLYAYIVMGATMAFAQMIGVRGQLKLGARWIWGYVAGMGIAFVAAVVLGRYVLRLEGTIDPWLTLIGTVGGFLTGTFQQPSLRPYTARHNLWPLLSAVVWGVTWATVEFIGPMAHIAFGVLSGGLIVWLLRVPPAEEAI
jgi:hypothetical protein